MVWFFLTCSQLKLSPKYQTKSISVRFVKSTTKASDLLTGDTVEAMTQS